MSDPIFVYNEALTEGDDSPIGFQLDTDAASSEASGAAGGPDAIEEAVLLELAELMTNLGSAAEREIPLIRTLEQVVMQRRHLGDQLQRLEQRLDSLGSGASPGLRFTSSVERPQPAQPDRDDQLQELRDLLVQARGQITEMRAELADSQSQQIELQGLVAAAQDELQQLQSQRNVARRELEQTQRHWRQQAEDYERRLNESRLECERVRQQLQQSAVPAPISQGTVQPATMPAPTAQADHASEVDSRGGDDEKDLRRVFSRIRERQNSHPPAEATARSYTHDTHGR